MAKRIIVPPSSRKPKKHTGDPKEKKVPENAQNMHVFANRSTVSVYRHLHSGSIYKIGVNVSGNKIYHLFGDYEYKVNRWIFNENILKTKAHILEDFFNRIQAFGSLEFISSEIYQQPQSEQGL